jgi:hypothetical protein
MKQTNRPQSSAPAFERLLANEEVLIVNPVLAQAIGLDASLVLRQLAYWLDQNEKKDRQKLFQEGRWWSFNSYEQWHNENFPFLSISSIRRYFGQLESLGLVISTQKYNPSPMLQSKWYSIDTEAYNGFMTLWEALGRPAANAGKTETKAAYARFLEEWQAAKTDLKRLESRLSIASQNAKSIPQNPADGAQAEDSAQAQKEAEAFIPPYWEHQALSSPHALEMLTGMISNQALSEDFIPREPKIVDTTTFSLLEFLAEIRLEAGDSSSRSEEPQPETLDAATAHFVQASETSAPRPFKSTAALIAPEPNLAGQAAAAELSFSNASLSDQQLSNQAEQAAIQTERAAIPSEQGDAQAEQSICSERAAHLLNLNSPIKEIIQETKTENQKEIQEQEQKAIASLCEAYMPARIVNDSLILEPTTTNPSSEKSSDGLGQDIPTASPELESAQGKNSTETLGAKLLSQDTSLAPQSQESGFARADSAKNQSATNKSKSSQAAPQAAANPSKPLATQTKAGNAGHEPATNPEVATPLAASSHKKAAATAQTPVVSPKAAAQTKATNAAQKPAANPKAAEQPEASTRRKAVNTGQERLASPKAAEQSQSSAGRKVGDILKKPARRFHLAASSEALGGEEVGNTAKKPKFQDKPDTDSAQTAAGGKLGNVLQDGRRAAEAKRLRTPGSAALGAKPAVVPNLYAEVVRRVFSSPSELLKADSAFVWLWVGFFRGRLKDTVMKSHKRQQLSDAPMDPATILAFSLWYRERYKQETLPRNPETLRARCEEFRALPSMEAWLEKGQKQLETLKQGFAQGIEPAELSTLLEKPHLRASDTGKAIDTSDMQDFDWKGFFERMDEHES